MCQERGDRGEEYLNIFHWTDFFPLPLNHSRRVVVSYNRKYVQEDLISLGQWEAVQCGQMSLHESDSASAPQTHTL